MTERVDQLLADPAEALVRGSFTGVDAEWWWERRIGGGLAVCQVLDPTSVSRTVSAGTGRDEAEVRRAVQEELGLEDDEPVVLTFEVPGDTTTREAARLLEGRSATPEGLAANLYRRVEEALLG